MTRVLMSMILELILMFLSFHIVCSFPSASIHWEVLLAISSFEPYSLIVASRYLKAVTSSGCVSPTSTSFMNHPFLLQITLVLSALIPIPAVIQVLPICYTRFLSSFSEPPRPLISSANRKLVTFLPLC